MKLGKIIKEYNRTYLLDEDLTPWAVMYGEELLAVAKAAKAAFDDQFYDEAGDYFIPGNKIEAALEELEKCN
jgi:hypothetical protein